jgi:preprotein translocase subunit YajC
MLMLVLMNEIFFFFLKKMQHKKTEKLNECVCVMSQDTDTARTVV